MKVRKGIAACIFIIVFVMAQWAFAETVVFNTGEIQGFDNLELTIEPFGWGDTHSDWEITRFLRHNRSMYGDFVRYNENEVFGEVGALIDRDFMLDHVRTRLRSIKNTEDIFDPVGNPGDGYEYDLHIVHSGSQPGVLEGDGPYHIIIMCQGFTGGGKEYETAYDDWLAKHYAEKDYIFVMPRLFENFSTDPRTGESNNSDILQYMLLMSDIASLQVSDTIDYLVEHFGKKVSKRNVTVIGHSNGGFVAQLAASKDWRISRIAFISSVFKLYGTWDGENLSGNYTNVIDSYDNYRYLNKSRVRWGRGPALHVQRGISSDEGCPPGIPCDLLVDMIPTPSPYDLSMDPWIPFEGCITEDCSQKTLTYYNWTIYEGPKEDGVKDNPYTDHGFGGEEGREEALRLLDEFFEAFPVN